MKERNCPSCNKLLTYQSKGAWKTANDKNSLCARCSTLRWQKEKQYDLSKEKNPFYGKKHTDKTKKKLSKIQKELANKPDSYHKSERSRKIKSIKSSGSNNPMYGKTVYGIWLIKYGKEEADKRAVDWKNKLSKYFSGKNNPMYGKMPHKHAGAGWSGWYKKWYFRSLRELSYVINVLEKGKLKWVSAETSNLTIPYKDEFGNERTYRADFLVDGKFLIEIKPKKLQKTKAIKLKAAAAKRFCKKLGITYQILDVELLTSKQIKRLVNNKKIKFTEKWYKKYVELYS